MTHPGQCATCAKSRRIESARKSVFWRCVEHDRDTRWPKYPPLPVMGCPRFLPAEPSTAGD